MAVDKLKMLKTVYGESEYDDVLLTYLELAKEVILNRLYPYDKSKTEVPAAYSGKQVTIACYLLNKRGAEGQIAHKELGIDRTYESADVPNSMLSDIIPYCEVF